MKHKTSTWRRVRKEIDPIRLTLTLLIFAVLIVVLFVMVIGLPTR